MDREDVFFVFDIGKSNAFKVVSKNQLKAENLDTYYELRVDCVLNVHDGGSDVDYLTFDEFEVEFNVYQQILSLKFFQLYMKRKIFIQMKFLIRDHKRKRSSKILSDNLLFMKPTYQTFLFDTRSRLHKKSKLSLFSTSDFKKQSDFFTMETFNKAIVNCFKNASSEMINEESEIAAELFELSVKNIKIGLLPYMNRYFI